MVSLENTKEGYKRFIDKRGYVWIHINKKLVYEHRYRYEQHYKTRLSSLTMIHHKNGIRHDNRIKNLKAVNREDHSKIHRIKKFCKICNSKRIIVLKDKYYYCYMCHKAYTKWSHKK